MMQQKLEIQRETERLKEEARQLKIQQEKAEKVALEEKKQREIAEALAK
jgi:hypothetical protein